MTSTNWNSHAWAIHIWFAHLIRSLRRALSSFHFWLRFNLYRWIWYNVKLTSLDVIEYSSSESCSSVEIFNSPQVVVTSCTFMVIYYVRGCLVLLYRHLICVSWMIDVIAIVYTLTSTTGTTWLSLSLTRYHLWLTWWNYYIVTTIVWSSYRSSNLFGNSMVSSCVASHQRVRLLCLRWVHIVSRFFLDMLNWSLIHKNTTSIMLLGTLSKILIHNFIDWLLVVLDCTLTFLWNDLLINRTCGFLWAQLVRTVVPSKVKVKN